jgi:hypothetical protein
MAVNQHSNVLLMKSEQESPALAVLQLLREFVMLLLRVKPMHKGAIVSEQHEVQLEEARRVEVYQKDQEDAVASIEAANQALSPPRTRDEWMDHLKRGLEPSIHYVLDRFSEGGDRHQQVLVYRAARLFNPVYAKTLTQERAYALIETLRVYHPLNKDSIIESLKASWHHYKEKPGPAWFSGKKS